MRIMCGLRVNASLALAKGSGVNVVLPNKCIPTLNELHLYFYLSKRRGLGFWSKYVKQSGACIVDKCLS